MANTSTSFDIHLFKRISYGDVNAFTEIYNRYFDLLFLHALKRLKDQEAAKDLIQDLFTALWNKRDSLANLSNPSHYLYTATRHGVLNYISRQKIQSSYIQSLPDLDKTTSSQTDHLIRENQLAAMIEKEINQLPEKMRQIFLLSRQEGLTHKQISEQLGLSELTVKTQVKNALRILRGKLGLSLYLLMLLSNK